MTTKPMRLFLAMLMICACASFAAAGDRYENIHIANGLHSAEIGDWVLFQMADGKTQKHTVIEKNGAGDEAVAVVQIVDFTGNVPTFSQKKTWPAAEPFMQPPMPDDKKYTFERRKDVVDFEGSALEVTIVDVFDKNNIVRTWYLSTEFPVYGVLKRYSDEKEDFHILTFGIGDSNTDPYVFPAAKKGGDE